MSTLLKGAIEFVLKPGTTEVVPRYLPNHRGSRVVFQDRAIVPVGEQYDLVNLAAMLSNGVPPEKLSGSLQAVFDLGLRHGRFTALSTQISDEESRQISKEQGRLGAGKPKPKKRPARIRAQQHP